VRRQWLTRQPRSFRNEASCCRGAPMKGPRHRNQRSLPAQIIPTSFPFSWKDLTKDWTREDRDMASAPGRPPGIMMASYSPWGVSPRRGQAALVTCRRRKKDTYNTGRAELRLRYIRDNADATPALSDSWPSSIVAGRRDECGCALHPSTDQSIIHDGASGRK
jgi:hypothetical protein